MTTDSDRVFADGIPIVLADGTHHLRYGMRGLKVLEDSFDGLDNLTRFLLGNAERRFGPLVDALAAGLVHEGLTTDALLDLAEPQRYKEYLDAVGEALDVAFPPPTGDAGPKEAGPSGSTGPTSTTSAPPSSVVPTMSSVA